MSPNASIPVDIAPSSGYVGKEKVEVKRLDDAIRPFAEPGESYYLKADTQGFERHVLDGAPETLKACKVVELELSITPVYTGCMLFGNM